MRRIFGLTVAATLVLGVSRAAEAQATFAVPAYGVSVTYGYGMPYGYGLSSGYGYGGMGMGGLGYGYGTGYGSPYGGFGYGYGPGPVGAGYYNYSARYSAYVAPGAPAAVSGYTAPVYATGYRTSFPTYGGVTTPYVSGASVMTAPYSGLPRPSAGLVPVR
jgi:hypothetical protein